MLKKIIPDIIEEFQEKVNEIISRLYDYLLEGKMFEFEEELHSAVTDLYVKLALAFITEVAKSSELEEKARFIGQKKGLGELRKAEVEIQLRTGHTIRAFSWFAARSRSKRKKKRGSNGSGCHLSTFWKEKHVEKMIFLRGLFLAGRWIYAMNFLARQNYSSTPYTKRRAA